jgi:hypothetical protein
MVLSFLVITSVTFSAPQEVDAESIAEARCMVVAVSVSNGQSSTQKSAAVMTAMYYFGRLDGCGSQSEASVENLIVREATGMTAEELRSEAARCGATLTRKGNELQAMGACLGNR